MASRLAISKRVVAYASLLLTEFVLSGCGLHSYLESGTVAATPRSPLVHLPRASDSSRFQANFALFGFVPMKARLSPRFSRQGKLIVEQPIQTEWDPMVASGEISWFANDQKPSRLFLGGDLVHGLRAFWFGWSVEDHFRSPVPIEFGIEVGKTKVIQRSQWTNQYIGSLGRSYDPSFPTSTSSGEMEWFWRLMVSASPREGGPWGGLECGVHPAVRNTEENVADFSLVAGGVGWFWRSPLGRIGVVSHAILIDDRWFGALRIQMVRDFGKKVVPPPKGDPAKSTKHHRVDSLAPPDWPPKARDWPESKEFPDTVGSSGSGP